MMIEFGQRDRLEEGMGLSRVQVLLWSINLMSNEFEEMWGEYVGRKRGKSVKVYVYLF